jgi:hypothetical protein
MPRFLVPVNLRALVLTRIQVDDKREKNVNV